MNESKLNMSKLAAESGVSVGRATPVERDGDREQLNFSRLEASPNDAVRHETAGRDEANLYQEALAYHSSAYAAVRQGQPFPIEPAPVIIRKIVDSLQEPAALFTHAVHRDYRVDTVTHHSVHVAILSVIMGSHLGIPASGLVQLGTAALLHDIGTAGCRTGSSPNRPR